MGRGLSLSKSRSSNGSPPECEEGSGAAAKDNPEDEVPPKAEPIENKQDSSESAKRGRKKSGGNDSFNDEILADKCEVSGIIL